MTPAIRFGPARLPSHESHNAAVELLAELRQRLAPKGRGVPFGVEVMGRVHELGSLEDVLRGVPHRAPRPLRGDH